MLSEYYPEPQVLIENEAKTLNFLRHNLYFCQEHSQFASDAGVVWGQIGYQQSFQFESYLNLTHSDTYSATHSGKSMRLFLGGRVVPKGPKSKDYDEVTYGLVVCRLRRNGLSILRKYHFDVAFPGATSRQKKFRFHLQYCGGLSRYLCRQGLAQSQIVPMHCWLSEPRLFFLPVSLALLVDAVLHEFPDEKSTNFRETNEWHNIMMVNEKLLLNRFHQKCADITSGRSTKYKRLADAFDVE